MSEAFAGWDKISEKVSQAQHLHDPKVFLGIEKQAVHPSDDAERRRRYLQRWISIKGERNRQWNEWRALSDFIMPELGRFLTSDHNKPKDMSKILANAPTRMARSLTAGLLAGHTSPAKPWVKFTFADEDLANWGPVKRALHELNRRFRMILELSNFYRVMAMGVYPGLATFGLGTCIAEEDFKKVIRFIPLAMGTYGIAGDGDGKVDTLQYEEAWTVSELVKGFGWGKVSNSVKVAWNGGWMEQYVAVLRTILPNEEYIPGAVGRRGGAWGSSWMELGGLSSASGALAQPSSDPTIGFLKDSHYNEFPVLCARWATTSRDIYPTGPGHDALNEARELMQLKRRILLGISKGMNPTLLIPDVLKTSRLSALPGDAIYYPTGTTGIEIKPAHVVDPRMISEAREEVQEVLQAIGQAFFSDIMLMFSSQSPGEGVQPDTAQEIAAKQQEKMLMLGPVLENINEFLTQMVERVIAIMSRRRLIPKFPKEVGNLKLKLEFVSPLAQAQKLVGAQAKERFVQFIGQVAQLDPKVLIKLDSLKMVDRYGDDIGVPPDVIRDEQQTQKLLEAQAQEAQVQKQAQAQLSAADAAKSLGKVPMDQDNLVTRMLGEPQSTQASGGAQ